MGGWVEKSCRLLNRTVDCTALLVKSVIPPCFAVIPIHSIIPQHAQEHLLNVDWPHRKKVISSTGFTTANK